MALSRTVREFLMYALVRSASSVVWALPWETARGLARLIAEVGCAVDRHRHKAVALENLRRAFPSLDEEARRRILRGVYRSLAESVVDSLNFLRLAGGGADEVLEMVGFEKLERLPRRTGVVFVTGHFGPWEVLGAGGPLGGYPVWSVARGFENRFIEAYVRRLRQGTGQRIIEKHGALRRVIRLVMNGQNVAFLMDQDARHGGIFVDFFGRPASTTPSPARVAIFTGAPVAFVYAQKVPGRPRFRAVLADLILPRPGADVGAETRRITQRLTRDLEELVRRHPEQWLWLHRRWKTYPGKYMRQRRGALLEPGGL